MQAILAIETLKFMESETDKTPGVVERPRHELIEVRRKGKGKWDRLLFRIY